MPADPPFWFTPSEGTYLVSQLTPDQAVSRLAFERKAGQEQREAEDGQEQRGAGQEQRGAEDVARARERPVIYLISTFISLITLTLITALPALMLR